MAQKHGLNLKLTKENYLNIKSAEMIVDYDDKGPWYTWHVVDMEDNESWFGGYGTVYAAFLGLISNQKWHGRYDRLQDRDANKIAKVLKNNITECRQLTEYFLKEFYDFKKVKK